FHSLFIALARTNKLPAKFEIGFALPPERGAGPVGGYHCWAQFSPDGKTWVPVDISQANQLGGKNPRLTDYFFGNLTEDRWVSWAARALPRVPPRGGPPLTFSTSPSAGGEAQPSPPARIRLDFRYKDVD